MANPNVYNLKGFPYDNRSSSEEKRLINKPLFGAAKDLKLISSYISLIDGLTVIPDNGIVFEYIQSMQTMDFSNTPFKVLKEQYSSYFANPATANQFSNFIDILIQNNIAKYTVNLLAVMCKNDYIDTSILGISPMTREYIQRLIMEGRDGLITERTLDSAVNGLRYDAHVKSLDNTIDMAFIKNLQDVLIPIVITPKYQGLKFDAVHLKILKLFYTIGCIVYGWSPMEVESYVNTWRSPSTYHVSDSVLAALTAINPASLKHSKNTIGIETSFKGYAYINNALGATLAEAD